MTRAELLQIANNYIFFTTENVRAILDGRKTQTRRVVKPQPVCYGKCLAQPCIDSRKFTYDKSAEALYCGECGNLVEYSPEGKNYAKQHNPRYQTGDILYARETFVKLFNKTTNGFGYHYRADGETIIDFDRKTGYAREHKLSEFNSKWLPSIHMTKEAARLFLRVTGVRAERIADISASDCKAEGIVLTTESPSFMRYRDYFCDLWDRQYKKDGYGWESNPWVWVYEFERVEVL
jgi:hypothetical protein